MFEPEAPKPEETKRNNLIIGGLSLAIVALIAVVIFIASSKPVITPTLPNAVHPGNAEFDNYKTKVTLDIVDRIVHPNMIGMAQYEIQTRVTNRGDRALTGIEIVGRMIDMNDQLLKESSSFPIPRGRTAPLQPGETFLASIKIDAPAKITEDQIKDLLVELRGLQF